MSRLDAQKLADLVGSPFAAQLVGAMPEPAVIVSADERAAAANQPALDLLPGFRVGDPFVLGLRAPDVIDARRRVMASGEAETVQWSERVPVERLFDVYCRAARDGRRAKSWRRSSPCAIRPKPGASSVCASTSSPTPAMNCARRSPRWSASSRPCKDRRATTPRRATGSSPSCANRGGAWPG